MAGPNFFVVGAAKSATTALYYALREHDSVYLPALKEPHFYAYLADPSTTPHLYPDRATARRQYCAIPSTGPLPTGHTSWRRAASSSANLPRRSTRRVPGRRRGFPSPTSIS